MLPDEIEFIIAKAKLDVELKFNEDQPRDENGRWTNGSGAPGTSPKSLEVAARISDVVRMPSRDIFEDGRRIFHDSEAIYTAKSGEQYKLKYTIEESHEGWEGKGDDRHRVYRDAAELSGQVFAYKEGSSDPVGSLTVTGKTEGYGDDRIFLPVMAVEQIVTKPSEQRQGIATAMLEFARAESPVPIVHGGAVSSEGQGFIDNVKSFDPDQPRDENGRWAETGSGKVAADISKQEWLAAIEKINLTDIEQMRPGDKYGDSFVERLAQLAGINGKPVLVESQYDLTGEPMHRGISDEKAEDMWGPVKPDGERDFFPGGRTSYRVFMDEFLHGDTSRFSSGNYGSGAYFSTSYSEAIGYSKLNPVDDVRIQDGEVLTGGFTADARVLETSHNTWDEDMQNLYAQFEAVYPDVKEIAGIDIEHSIATKAMMLGWDGLKVSGASGTTGGDYFVVYNRGALEMVGK